MTFYSLACAQDTTAREKKGIVSTARKKLNDIKAKLSSQIDSAYESGSSAVDTSFTIQDESLKTLSTATQQPSDSLQKSGKILTATINQKPVVQGKLSEIEETIYKPVNEINLKILSIDNTMQKTIATTEKKVNAPINQAQSKVSDGFSKATDGEVKLPSKDITITGSKVNASETTAEISGIKVPQENLTIIDLQLEEELPGMEKLPVSYNKLDVGQLKNNTGIDIPGKRDIKMVTAETAKLDGSLADAERYENEVRQVEDGDLASTEKLSELAENKVAALEPVRSFSEQAQKITAQQAQYEAMIQRYKDKKALQQEIMRKAQNVANEELNQYSPILKKSQEQLARVKRLNSNVKSYNEIKNKRTNEMKNKPLYERLVPGLAVQVYNKNIFAVDWGAQLAYKFSSRFWTGVGGFYRTSFSKNNGTWIKGEHVYGIRSYLNFGLLKSFYAHGELCAMLGKYDTRGPVIEPGSHKIYSAHLGLGKRYDISHKLKGSILVLYRAEIKGDLPSMSKLNMRIEFNFNTKKRKHSISRIMQRSNTQ